MSGINAAPLSLITNSQIIDPDIPITDDNSLPESIICSIFGFVGNTSSIKITCRTWNEITDNYLDFQRFPNPIASTILPVELEDMEALNNFNACSQFISGLMGSFNNRDNTDDTETFLKKYSLEVKEKSGVTKLIGFKEEGFRSVHFLSNCMAKTPLDLAIRHGSYGNAKLLCDRYPAYLHVANSFGTPSIMYLLSILGAYEINTVALNFFKYFLQMGVRLDKGGDETPLHILARKPELQCLFPLIKNHYQELRFEKYKERRIKIIQTELIRFPSLLISLITEYFSKEDDSIKGMMNVDVKCKMLRTPLSLAIYNKNKKAVEFLIEAGANPSLPHQPRESVKSILETANEIAPELAGLLRGTNT